MDVARIEVETAQVKIWAQRWYTFQRTHWRLSVKTSKKIHGYKFTELSMPERSIDIVHALEDAEEGSYLDGDGYPIFKWELWAPATNECEEFIHHHVISDVEFDEDAEDDQSKQDDNYTDNDIDDDWDDSNKNNDYDIKVDSDDAK